MDSCRLFEAELSLLKLHELGYKADIWRNTFSMFGNIGIGGFEGPSIRMDQVGEYDSDGT
jgi:hypothetical protein